jgi:hypothetical protein
MPVRADNGLDDLFAIPAALVCPAHDVSTLRRPRSRPTVYRVRPCGDEVMKQERHNIVLRDAGEVRRDP